MRGYQEKRGDGLVKLLEQLINVKAITKNVNVEKEKIRLQAMLLIQAKKISKIENIFDDYAEVIILPVLSKEELAHEVKIYNEAAVAYNLEKITYEKLYYSYVYGCEELRPLLYKLKERMRENKTTYQEQN